MKQVLIVLLFLYSINLSAQTFNTNNISDSLKTNANIIKRYEEIILEIKSPSKSVSHQRHVYTVLNEYEDGYSNKRSYYNKFTKIDYISSILYDGKGKELKHVKQKEMVDLPYNDGFSLMQDTRYLKNSFYCRTYPYTVDYEEDNTDDGLLYFPEWTPAESTDMSVQYSKYVIIAPNDYEVRYKQLHFKLPPVITHTADKKIYTWEINNITAQEREVLAPSGNGIALKMLLAPSDFEAEGYKGNMSNWKNYGKFIYQLQKGRDILPDDIKKKVHELTDNLNISKQKIYVLYNYLQENTHYISIQLGIGGWQPFDATYVATKKYGDCKALSNYMVALLKEVGIIGNYVEIKAEKGAVPIETDFSEFQFNHIICCVPLLKDTVWLECTSQSLPAGYLSSFTANRWGLLINENGGTLVHTPKYGLNDNVEIKKINATINEEGNLIANVNATYKALQQDNLAGVINYYSNDKVLEYLKSTIDLPTYDIKHFNYTQHKDVIPTINESLELNADNYAQVTGKRMFINPNIFTKSNKKLALNENRKYDLELNDEYINIDTVEITIPVGYKQESTFNNTTIESKFGKYKTQIKVLPTKIIYYRNQAHYSGSFLASDYAELVRFYENIYKADHAKLVLVKQE